MSRSGKMPIKVNLNQFSNNMMLMPVMMIKILSSLCKILRIWRSKTQKCLVKKDAEKRLRKCNYSIKVKSKRKVLDLMSIEVRKMN